MNEVGTGTMSWMTLTINKEGKMTIVEAIKRVLENCNEGLTSREIYKGIIDKDLYTFPAKDPVAVVNSTIRRHCLGLDFPTANAIKHFRIISYKGKKPCYGLLDVSLPPHTAPIQNTDESQLLPEEKIQSAYKAHIALIEAELIRLIMQNHPSFFEKLIVDLLIKMGYGYDQSAGIVVGGPHDGGIDGIISEDNLGLDQIYLQAKRYKQGKNVGSQEVNAFIGSMKKVQKGVFITTSSFTKEAKKAVEEEHQKHVKLIDGKMLTSLMVKYEVGIIPENEIKIDRPDTAYFE